MSDQRADSPTLRLRRLDASSLEITEVMREGRLSTLFQPIVDPRSPAVCGFEALTRGPSDSWLHSPQNLFEAARHSGMKVDLDFVCFTNAVRRFVKARVPGQLFVNVSPDTIYDEPNFAQRFLTVLEEERLSADRCVMELTEESLLEDYARLRSALKALRASGCGIAIDDLGAGSSGLKTWSELKPDYVKIDRYFVSSIDSDITKREFVRSIIDMGRAIGCRIIGEGVETDRECRELLDLGIDRLQGHLFGRPSATPVVTLQQVDSLEHAATTQTALCAEHISVPVPPVAPDVRVSEVAERFRIEPELLTVAVVDDGKPLGVVRRDQLFALMAKPLHTEIYSRKPVVSVMESPTLTIDAGLRLEQVSRLVTSKGRPRLTEEFVITKEGRYLGLGQTFDLLRQITDQQLQAAKHSNPLTLLPGNAVIRDTIDRLIEKGRRFVVCYADLDGFKPYNDRYGYAQGDQVLLHVSNLLKEAFSKRLDMVGHVGGDDFLIVMRSADWRQRAGKLLENFSQSVSRFYSSEDFERGGMFGQDRSGETRNYPLLSLSLAALDSETLGATSADSIAQLLAHVKQLAKQRPGNSFILRSGDRLIDLLPTEGAITSGEYVLLEA